ncbi:hypothetical protein PENTCL1PPCAC_19335, partial [Pristionchus entomophagus]
DNSSVATNWAEWLIKVGREALVKQYQKDVYPYIAAKDVALGTLEERQETYKVYRLGCLHWNRVALENKSFKEGFYNANSVFLNGDELFRVIAAQGPSPFSADKFWHMIYQEKVSTIVQLCEYVEDYWPRKRPLVFEGFTISLESQGFIDENVPNIQLRTFVVAKEGSSESHRVRHIFFNKWPDFDVPETVAPVVAIVQWLEEHGSMSMQSPLLVHCMAGVGRTGSLILTLMALRFFKSLRNTHQAEFSCQDYSTLIMGLAKELRRHRDDAIQTCEQYTFAHAALLKLLVLEGLVPDDDRVRAYVCERDYVSN